MMTPTISMNLPVVNKNPDLSEKNVWLIRRQLNCGLTGS